MSNSTLGDAAIAVVRRNTEEVQGKGNWRVFEELFGAISRKRPIDDDSVTEHYLSPLHEESGRWEAQEPPVTCFSRPSSLRWPGAVL